MSEQQKLSDLLPITKHRLLTGGVNNQNFHEEYFDDFYKVSDVETFLEKITQPAILTKLIQSLVLKKPLNFEELLK